MIEERKPIMEPVIITETQTEFGSRYFNVAQGNRCADKLNWDEMLGQLVNLTHPEVRRPHYQMHFLTKDMRERYGLERREASTPVPDFAEVGEARKSPRLFWTEADPEPVEAWPEEVALSAFYTPVAVHSNIAPHVEWIVRIPIGDAEGNIEGDEAERFAIREEAQGYCDRMKIGEGADNG